MTVCPVHTPAVRSSNIPYEQHLKTLLRSVVILVALVCATKRIPCFIIRLETPHPLLEDKQFTH